MMKEYATNKNDLSQILSRKYGESLDVTQSVLEIIQNVQARKDEALFEYTAKFDQANLKQLKVSQEELIQQIVVADVNTYVKTFYNQKDDISLSVYDRLLKIIDADMVEFAQQVVSLVERYIKLVSRERFLYAFGLHLSSLFNRIKGKQNLHNALEGTIDTNSIEFI